MSPIDVKKSKMWLETFMATVGITGYNLIIRGEMETTTKHTENIKYKGVTDKMKMLNQMEYNELIISLEDTICLQIV